MSLLSSLDQAVRANVAAVRERIARAAARSGRPADTVTLIAVCKAFPRAYADAAVAAGVADLGENRVQEAREKFAAGRPPGARLHLIGTLQSNKAKLALDLFDVIHSVDRLDLAVLLSRLAGQRGQTIDVLAEANVSGEPTKHGFAPSDLLAALPALVALPHLRWRGLMTIAPLGTPGEAARPFFATLAELRLRCQAVAGPAAFTELSMGMTEDFEVAIEEGATMVRIGRAIFGPRPPR